jgi:hypothetical protein
VSLKAVVLKLGVAPLVRFAKYVLRVAKVQDCHITLDSAQGSTPKPSQAYYRKFGKKIEKVATRDARKSENFKEP